MHRVERESKNSLIQFNFGVLKGEKRGKVYGLFLSWGCFSTALSPCRERGRDLDSLPILGWPTMMNNGCNFLQVFKKKKKKLKTWRECCSVSEDIPLWWMKVKTKNEYFFLSLFFLSLLACFGFFFPFSFHLFDFGFLFWEGGRCGEIVRFFLFLVGMRESKNLGLDFWTKRPHIFL